MLIIGNGFIDLHLYRKKELITNVFFVKVINDLIIFVNSIHL
jgi:hypothetical protein